MVPRKPATRKKRSSKAVSSDENFVDIKDKLSNESQEITDLQDPLQTPFEHDSISMSKETEISSASSMQAHDMPCTTSKQPEVEEEKNIEKENPNENLNSEINISLNNEKNDMMPNDTSEDKLEDTQSFDDDDIVIKSQETEGNYYNFISKLNVQLHSI